jgi:tetratricopeptide (TPR) repeat protein
MNRLALLRMLAIALAGMLVLGNVLPAADDAGQAALEARIASLIEQLGAEDFAAREKAQAELAQLGLEAFDTLHAAQHHHDPEIALRARYLVRSMSVRWFSESDSPEVVRILKGYGDLPEAERRNRMDRLGALEKQQGVAPLCRLARFETTDPLAKHAALKVLELTPPEDGAAKADLAKTIAAIAATSKRPAAAWLRLYARTLADPATMLPQWNEATQAEHALLAKHPERTSREIVRDLYRFQVETLKRLQRDDEAIAVIRRTFGLLEGAPDQVLEIVDWLMQRQAWPVVLELAGGERFAPTFQESPLLLYRIAEAHLKLGQSEKADETAQKALSLRPENLEEHLRLGYMLEQERGLHAWAQREYREVLKAAPAGSVPQFRGRFYLSELLHDQLQELPAAEALKPVCDLMQKDEAAKETCIRALRSPEGVIARMNYFFACHYHEQGNAAKEKEHLQAAVDADPTDADVLIAMYRLPQTDASWKTTTRQKIDEAAKSFHTQIEEAQQNLNMAGNEQSTAAASYELSLAANQYAWLVGNTIGDYDEAVKMSHRSLELRPNYPGFLDTLGRCYYAKGDLASAVKYQSQAVKINPYSGQIRRQLDFFRKEAKDRGVTLPEGDAPQP